MTMNRLITSAIIGLLLGIGSACRDRDVVPEQASAQYQGEIISLDLGGALEVDSIPEPDQDLRTISIGHEEVTHRGRRVLKPTIRLREDREGRHSRVRLFIRKHGDPGSLSVADLPAKIRRDPKTQRYYFDLLSTSVQLKKANQKLTEGEWYIAGFYGGKAGAQVAGQPRYEIDVLHVKTSPAKASDVVEYDFPIAFGWTKLERATVSGGKSYGIHRNLRFRPVGTLLGLEIENDLVEDVTLQAIRMSRVAGAFSGVFDPDSDADDALRRGDVPSFRPGVADQAYSEKQINPQSITLPAAQRYAGRLYVWFMPQGQARAINFTLEAEQRRSYSSPNVPVQDRFKVKNREATFNDSFRYSVSTRSGFKSGQVYIFPLKIVSDLMITEVYHHYKNGLSFAAVELYNPNKTEIDLNNYALARIKNQFLVVQYCDMPTPPPRGCPANRVKSRLERFTLYAPHLRSSDRVTNTKLDPVQNALILPLTLRPDHDWRPYSLGIKQNNTAVTGAESYSKNPIKVRFLTDSGYGVLSGNAVPTPARPTLAGGKTMIVLGDGYLAEGATLRTGGVSQQVVEAYKRGYCQYIVALDNRSTDARSGDIVDNRMGGFSANRHSGVMNLRYEDGLLLIKRSQRGGQEVRQVIDTTTPNVFSGESSKTGNVEDYWLNMMDLNLSGPTAVYSPNYQTRTVIERVPSYGWSNRHWHVQRTTTDLRSIVSLGSRRWLGSDDPATWGAVPMQRTAR